MLHMRIPERDVDGLAMTVNGNIIEIAGLTAPGFRIRLWLILI